MKVYRQIGILLLALLFSCLGTGLASAQLVSPWSEEEINQEISKIEFACLLADAVRAPKDSGGIRVEGISDSQQYCLQALPKRRVFNPLNIEAGFAEDEPFALWMSYHLALNFFGFFDRAVVDYVDFELSLSGLRPDAFYGPTMSRALSLKLFNPGKQNYQPTRATTRYDALLAVSRLLELKELLEESEESAELIILPEVDRQQQVEDSALTNDPAFSILADVYQQLRTDYLYVDELEEENLLYEAIRGMVSHLDPYTVFFDNQEANQFEQTVNGEVEGVGISLALTEAGEVEVIAPLAGSPAEKGGIKSGDIITAIDGGRIPIPADLDEVISLIKGRLGTQVKLSVKRNGTSLSFELTRTKVILPDVAVRIEDNVALINLYTFADDTDTNLAALLKNTKLTGLKGIVIDLRNNPGGYLDTAIFIAELFLEPGKVITQLQGPGVFATETSSVPATVSGLPIAILINGGSASASEVLAAALRDNLNNVKLVGEQSFGKGTVQDVTRYADGSSFKMTVAAWLTPKGKSINQVGLTPDIVEKDPAKQLAAAISSLR